MRQKLLYFLSGLLVLLLIGAAGSNPTIVQTTAGITNYSGSSAGIVIVGLSTNGAAEGATLTFSGGLPVWISGGGGGDTFSIAPTSAVSWATLFFNTNDNTLVWSTGGVKMAIATFTDNNGGSLTNLNASNITQGQLSVARISANTILLNRLQNGTAGTFIVAGAGGVATWTNATGDVSLLSNGVFTASVSTNRNQTYNIGTTQNFDQVTANGVLVNGDLTITNSLLTGSATIGPTFISGAIFTNNNVNGAFNVGGNVISNLANGTLAHHAVNLSQLQGATNGLSGGSGVSTNGAFTYQSYRYGTNGVQWVNDAPWKRLADFDEEIGFWDTNAIDFLGATFVTNSTAISGSARWNSTNANWYAFYGGPTNTFANADSIKVAFANGTAPFGVGFQTISTNFDIAFRANSGWITVFIDNKRASVPFQTDATSGAEQRLRVNLATGRKWREFFVTFTDGMGWSGVISENSDHFIPPANKVVGNIMLIGDSGMRGYGATNEAMGFAMNLVRATKGRLNVLNNTQNGTGYLTGGNNTYGVRGTNGIAMCTARGIAIDAFVIGGGGGDNASNTVQIVTGVTNTLQMLANAAPNVERYIYRPIDTTVAPTFLNVTTNIQTGADLAGVPTLQTLFTTNVAIKLVHQSGTFQQHPNQEGYEGLAKEFIYRAYTQSNFFNSFNR